MPKYTRQQFWKLYPKLPQDLKEALGSEETSKALYEVCKRNGILNQLEEIVELTGQVLLGLLLPQDFQRDLEKEIKIKKSISQKVAQEINRFIFYPVRPSLERLYQVGIKTKEGVSNASISKTREKSKVIKKSKTPDKYRESI